MPTPFKFATPQPKKRRVKMLARKKVAGRELSKKLNTQLKASQAQEPQNSDESFKSATEGEEIGSSDTEHVTSGTNTTNEVISVVVENLENRFTLVGFVVDVETSESRKRGGKNKKEKEKESKGVRSEEKGMGKRVVDSSPTSDEGRMAICGAKSVEESVKKTGGSGSSKAAEGLINLGQNVDEPGSLVEETLADLLKKVGDNYNPKKKRTSLAKTPGTSRANKKRKVVPFDTVEIPPTRERATRSQLKQNEEEMQKELEESKKKRMDKGKKKVGEPVEAVDVDEMDLVHQDENKNVEVKVQTPKPKKATTSTKKSTPMSKSTEPSTREKRTRSAMKPKQVKIAEEEEWSGEEDDESDSEKDKMAMFRKRTILKGRILNSKG
ncbi:PREDICTED: uncharacterized protein LOC109219905 [Nicotiana attenuata]|uniref:uncharacterized protein LOC109219905 n=1 Tax=Nicotiana attenuata TaxID=49451 RepID=UPI0009046D42|nr:PREDICTED: uncharacterized protein LOC109219905 [Nicotiana attenuata]